MMPPGGRLLYSIVNVRLPIGLFLHIPQVKVLRFGDALLQKAQGGIKDRRQSRSPLLPPPGVV